MKEGWEKKKHEHHQQLYQERKGGGVGEPNILLPGCLESVLNAFSRGGKNKKGGKGRSSTPSPPIIMRGGMRHLFCQKKEGEGGGGATFLQ